MEHKEDEVDVSRRDLFGVLGGVAGIAALTGCTNQAGAAERTGRLAEPLVAGSTSDNSVKEIRFPLTTDAAQTSTLLLPDDGVVTSVRLDIVTPYSQGATIQVGQAEATCQLMAACDNTPQACGLYVVDQDTPWGPSAPILVTVSGAPSAGAGVCIVQYVCANEQNTPGQTNTSYPTLRGGINLPSTYGITLTQGGTLQSPTIEFPLVIQPRDPSKAPYQLRLHGFQFNSTIDDVLFFGYNANGGTSNKPICRFAIEQDYEFSPGQHQLECYFEAVRIPSEAAVRPMGFVIDRTTGNTTTFLQYAGIGGLSIVGGPVGGPPTQQIKWTDSQMLFVQPNYVIASQQGLIIENLAGALDIRNGTGNLNLLSLGSNSIVLLAGGRISIADSTVAQLSVIDNRFGTTQFYPARDNTGSIGINGLAWSTVFTYGINVSVTPTTAATAGSKGPPPGQVAGYLPITVGGTNYLVPLYNT